MDVHEMLNKKMSDDFSKLTGKVFIEIPPKIFREMDARFIAYERKKSLKVEFPVKEWYANPMMNMQGGMIATAFDCVFGPLSYLIAARPVTTLDMSVNYIRPIPVGETITIEGKLIVRGFSTMNMAAECYDKKGRLMATATTNMLILNTK
ncbi:MAG: PaaI family thioesterase [Leptospiraceae bacterium]|nr:PaaI family thioesterase [Leptospiraceae bacterium]MCP5501981.1 PaaI family thioesterase [Leptospiraceae bacterium]